MGFKKGSISMFIYVVKLLKTQLLENRPVGIPEIMHLNYDCLKLFYTGK